MSRPEPRWLGRLAIDEAHFRQIREHGGAYGLRDEAALESALARPRQRWRYEPESRLADLAAAYGFGLVRNHPYVDGNKRIGLVAIVAFLDLNGVEFTAANAGAFATIVALASGTLSEVTLARWIEDHSTSPRGPVTPRAALRARAGAHGKRNRTLGVDPAGPSGYRAGLGCRSGPRTRGF